MHWRCSMQCTTVCMHGQPKEKYHPSHIHRKAKSVPSVVHRGLACSTQLAAPRSHGALHPCGRPSCQSLMPSRGGSIRSLKNGRSAAGTAVPQNDTALEHGPLDAAAAASRLAGAAGGRQPHLVLARGALACAGQRSQKLQFVHTSGSMHWGPAALSACTAIAKGATACVTNFTACPGTRGAWDWSDANET